MMIFTTVFPAQEMATYAIIAPGSALPQQVAGDTPQNHPIIDITKNVMTAKYIAIDFIDFSTGYVPGIYIMRQTPMGWAFSESRPAVSVSVTVSTA